MEKKKKLTLIIIIFLVVVALTTFYFLFIKPRTSISSKIITQKTLTTVSTQDIDISSLNINTDKITGNIYSLSSKMMLDGVTSFVKQLDKAFVQTTSQTGVFYEWNDGENSVIYELQQNTLLFDYAKGLVWNEATLNAYSFHQFISSYFGKSWNYTLVNTKKLDSGETVYYAKRVLNQISIEMTLDNQETDYLAVKNGKIIYGKLLLTDFMDANKSVPLISKSDLQKYINVYGYPKEVYPQLGNLAATTLAKIDYKSETFSKIINTMTDCKSTDYEVVYLYKSFNQENLIPVYRLNLLCDITYQGDMYKIPAVAYVNAVDPNYISSGE